MTDLDSLSDNASPTAMNDADNFMGIGIQFDQDDQDHEDDEDLDFADDYTNELNPSPIKYHTKKSNSDYFSNNYINKKNELNLIDQIEKIENENDEALYYDDDNFDNNSLGLSESTFDGNSKDFENVHYSKNDQLKMIYMRSYINKIAKKFQEKDQITQSIRQEIVNCKQRMEALEKKRDEMFDKLQNENNVTIANRLDAEHATLCQEIELETRVLEKLNETFTITDYDRSKALLEKTRYAKLDQELKTGEKLVMKLKEKMFHERKKVEDKKINLIKKKLEISKQIENERILIENQKQKETIERAKLARQVTARYLQKTLREIKDKGSEEETHSVQANEAKRKDLLALKNVIDHNKEIFQSKVNRNKFNQIKNKQLLEQEKKEIKDRGENPNFYMPRKIKLDEFEEQRQRFEEEQELNKQQIVKKILTENQNLEKKKVLYPNLFNINLKPLKQAAEKDKGDVQLLAKLATSMGIADENFKLLTKKQHRSASEHDDKIADQRSFCDSTTIASRDDDDSDFDELANQEEVVFKPEFDGLWNKQFKKYDAQDFYKTQQKFPACFKSKSEKELFLKSLDKLKKSAVREQVAAGRKFTGSSFRSQPKVIHFKDFNLGETYDIKVVLTNISYTINTCKIIDITEKLKDFITVDFKPPGQLSAGLTCELNVKFEPKINKDLKGEISFLASNGPFLIPIFCTIKKCDLSVNSESVYFGTTVIGETLNRKVQLINKGALGTKFKLLTLKEFNKVKKAEIKAEGENNTTAEVVNVPEEVLDTKLDELKIGEVKEGFVGPFSTVDLEIVFFPTFPGKFNEQFVLEFEDEKSKDINIVAKATAVDVPIWLENINIDLKICMYDRLYQDVIRVHNRANTALRITFDIPAELKNHLEILPKTAFIQAKSDFSAQLKFTARSSLASDSPKYFDPLTSVLEVPLFIKVSDQNKTVNYNLHAVVTTSDLEFDVYDIDFGHCTIYETVRSRVKLTNNSILCQPFGFVRLPDYVNVQPNDGFGTLLPNETIPIDINFCPNVSKEFKFQVVCKSLVNRDFVINCRGIGVHPPLRLTAQRINFKATSLHSTSYKTFYVVNEHVDYDQHRHPVPRIGNGEIALVGSTYFEFDLPERCPFMLSPCVGLVEQGKKVKITIEYKADVDDIDIRKEATKLIKQRLSERASKLLSEQTAALQIEETETKEAAKDSKQKKKSQAASNKAAKPSSAVLHSVDLNPKTPHLDTIEHGSQDYLAGHSSVLANYKGSLHHFEIPCYVSTVTENPESSKPIPYDIHNTLYLSVVCPSVKPEIVILAKEHNKIDFGKVSIGHKCIRKIGIKNISDSTIELESNFLNPAGPFNLLNALRPVPPGEIHNLIIAFSPTQNCIYHEQFELKTKKSNLHFVLKAAGVEPSFSLSFEENTWDFGYCLANDKLEKAIEMKNNSNVPIEFRIELDSLIAQSKKDNEIKRFLNSNDPKYKSLVGPSNYSGISPFDVNPIHGTITAGSKVDVKVFFSPDHTSELYADTMRISLLSNEKNSRVIQLFGKSRTKNIYIRGVEHLTANLNTESMVLADVEPVASTEEAGKDQKEKGGKVGATEEISVPIPILVTLYSISKSIGENAQAEKVIYIGCMKSTNTADKKDAKKNGDFTFDNVKDINLKGFNIDLLKSAVEAGGERAVKITWKPPLGTDPKQTMQTSILLTTRSNCIETWKLILQGRIVAENQTI